MTILLILLAALWTTALAIVTLAGSSTSTMADRALACDEAVVASPSHGRSTLAA